MKTNTSFKICSQSRPRRYAASVVLMSGLTLAGWTSIADGAELNVCKSGCTYASVQNAIDAASSGDVINVGLGTYFENLVIQRKNLSIIGAGEDSTVLDGKFSGLAVDVGENGHPVSLTMFGVTVTHGGSGGIGVAPDSTLNLQSSMVISNRGGSGIANFGTVTVSGSIIAHNSSPGLGGGIYNDDESTLTVVNTTIARNTATDGGGIAISSLGVVSISGSTLSDNTANGGRGDGLGGGIYIEPYAVHSPSGTLTISSSSVVDNHAAGDAGGIYGIACTPNATIARNSPDDVEGGDCSR